MEIKTFEPSSHKIKTLIYGAAGSGKTQFAGTAPKIIWAAAENGLLTVAESKPQYVDIRSVVDLQNLHNFLLKGEHKFETVVLDTITELNERIKEGLSKGRGGQMQLRDWGTLSQTIKKILRDFMDLDMHVIFLAQEALTKDEDRIEKITPALNGKTEYEIPRYFDIVGYSYVTGGKNTPRVHHIDTDSSEKTLSKNRGGRIGNHEGENMSFMDWMERINRMEISEKPTFGKSELEKFTKWIKDELNDGKTNQLIVNGLKQKYEVPESIKEEILKITSYENPDDTFDEEEPKVESKEQKEQKDYFNHYKEEIEKTRGVDELLEVGKVIQNAVTTKVFSKDQEKELMRLFSEQKTKNSALEAFDISDRKKVTEKEVDQAIADAGIEAEPTLDL